MSANKEVKKVKEPTQIELAEQKAEHLSKEKGIAITHFAIPTEEEGKFVIGYFKKPSLIVSVKAWDLISAGQRATAGMLLFEPCIVKEESDPRILEDDDIKLAAYFEAVLMAIKYQALGKKK